jgi:hypothetical protein
MRIMGTSGQSSAHPQCRHDGWTPERRHRFLGFLAAAAEVKRAGAAVALSRQPAYGLRRRDPAFAQAWDEALRSARRADEEAFLAMLPEALRRTMSELSGACELRAADSAARHPVRVVSGV